MKLSKTKKILLSGTTLTILTTSIAVPIVLLNKDETKDENDLEKLSKILKDKTTKEKIIELPSDASGKIIANNQEKIVEKIKALIGKENLEGTKIEVLIQNDVSISTTPQKIIVKITKNELSKQIKDFLVKKQSVIDVDEDIEAIKKILDTKTGNDLIIILPSSSTGNIIGNATNKNAIIKKLRILVDSSNTNGEVNHSSLRGTSIQVSMGTDGPISTISQNIIVSISKTGGTTLRTSKIFQVKREFTPNEDIAAIKKILDSLTSSKRTIILPSSSSGSLINNQKNKEAIERKIRTLIDPLNINGEANHSSLRGTTITLTEFLPLSLGENDLISTTPKTFFITISKTGGTSLKIVNFFVKKSRN